MKLIDTFAPAPPGVGARCARKRLRRSRCEHCVARCPTGALAWRDGDIHLLAERCTGCGICLFVCPADALENLAPLRRHYRDGVLLGPFTLPVAVGSCYCGIRITAFVRSQWISRCFRTGCNRLPNSTCGCASAASRAGDVCQPRRCQARRRAVGCAARGDACRMTSRRGGPQVRYAQSMALRWRHRAVCYAGPVEKSALRAPSPLAMRRSRSTRRAAPAAATARQSVRQMP